MNTILRVILSLMLLTWMVTTAQGQSESRDGELQTLIREMEHREPMVRARAAGRLGTAQSDTAVGPLIAALGDSVADVQTDAEYALVQIDAPAVEPEALDKVADGAAVPALSRVVAEDPDARMRILASRTSAIRPSTR